MQSNILESGNNYIYSLGYSSELNPIENFFSQLKNHVKNSSPDNYEFLKSDIKRIIKDVITKIHLKNYFKYLFLQAKEYIKK